MGAVTKPIGKLVMVVKLKSNKDLVVSFFWPCSFLSFQQCRITHSMERSKGVKIHQEGDILEGDFFVVNGQKAQSVLVDF